MRVVLSFREKRGICFPAQAAIKSRFLGRRGDLGMTAFLNFQEPV
jgi:hypothetical protein